VTLEAYSGIFEYQTIKNIFISEDSVRKAFAPYVINEQLLDQLGPAVNSGKSMFLYGPPGNGKTVIAETVGSLMGEEIYIPYAICVDQQIINVYDPINHMAAPECPPVVVAESGFSDICTEFDQRWLLCQRPVVLVGGELTLGMLDLDFNEVSKYYEAPVQVKANGGVFIIDDFGRQMVRPRELLNRWIVPLERRTDFLTLHTGKKFEVPFDELVIFSTNIEPKELVDEAFLRRIRYKIQITHPVREEYVEIFRRICENNGLEYREEIVKYLLDEHYEKTGIKMNACHPRDIIDQIIDISRYKEMTPRLEKDIIDEAWNNYFVEI
jgi:predicted ATPase with chaperone activity